LLFVPLWYCLLAVLSLSTPPSPAYLYSGEERLVSSIHTRGIIGFMGIEQGRDVSPLLVNGALMS